MDAFCNRVDHTTGGVFSWWDVRDVSEAERAIRQLLSEAFGIEKEPPDDHSRADAYGYYLKLFRFSRLTCSTYCIPSAFYQFSFMMFNHPPAQ